MLNQLEQLSQRLETALQFTEQLLQEKQTLTTALAQLNEEASALRAERLELLNERARLSNKIEDAQARIQSILNKLPPDDSKRQLDLLNPATVTPNNAAPSTEVKSPGSYTPSYGLNVKPGVPL